MDLTRAVEQAIAALRAEAPGYLAAGVVDLSTGMLLGVHTTRQHPQDVLDVLAAAAADLFEGRRVGEIRRMWSHRGSSGREPQAFEEILLHSEDLVHLFVRSRAVTDLVTAVVCRRSANLGLLLSVGRQAAALLEES